MLDDDQFRRLRALCDEFLEQEESGGELFLLAVMLDELETGRRGVTLEEAGHLCAHLVTLISVEAIRRRGRIGTVSDGLERFASLFKVFE